MQAIGIDIGTTSICGVSIDTETGCIIKSVTGNSNADAEGCASWEKIQSVDKIISIASEITDALITADTAVIGVTGQMHGIVYVDVNGSAVSPLYTWQDGRGNLPRGEATYAEYLGSCSGYGGVTDFYNRENGIRPQKAVSYCTIHDYFVMKLCGLSAPIIHDTDFASFGCCEENVETVSDFAVAGIYKGIPVSVAIGDNQASVFSTLADEDDILINIGTGSQISVISDKRIVAENIEVRPYFGGKYLIVGAALCGGRAYSLLRDFYLAVLGFSGITEPDEVYGIMNKMIDGESLSLKVDTRFAGTRSDKSVTGSVTGITAENFTPGQLTLGVMDGMIEELYNMYLKMNCSKKGIVGSGNGIRKNPGLVKIAEGKFGCSMKIPAHLEEAAVGAAFYGCVAAGICNNIRELIKYGE